MEGPRNSAIGEVAEAPQETDKLLVTVNCKVKCALLRLSCYLCSKKNLKIILNICIKKALKKKKKLLYPPVLSLFH